MKKTSSKLLTAAVSGLLIGSMTGCKMGDDTDGGGEHNTTAPDAFGGLAKHACAGHNDCANKGGCKSKGGCMGKNSCRGEGGCATVTAHSCGGKNSCKGLGGCKTDANSCKGKNDCRSKGGCHVGPKH